MILSKKSISQTNEPVNLHALYRALDEVYDSLASLLKGAPIFWGVADTCLRTDTRDFETRQCLQVLCRDGSFVIVALDGAEIVRQGKRYDATKMRTDFWAERWYFAIEQENNALLKSLLEVEDGADEASDLCGEEKTCSNVTPDYLSYGDLEYREGEDESSSRDFASVGAVSAPSLTELACGAEDYVASPSTSGVGGVREKSPIIRKGVRRKKGLARPLVLARRAPEAGRCDRADEATRLKRVRAQRAGIRDFMTAHGVCFLSDDDCNAIIASMSSHSLSGGRLTDPGYCLVRRPHGQLEVMATRTVNRKKIPDADVFLRNGKRAAPRKANLEMLWRRVQGEDGWLAEHEG